MGVRRRLLARSSPPLTLSLQLMVTLNSSSNTEDLRTTLQSTAKIGRLELSTSLTTTKKRTSQTAGHCQIPQRQHAPSPSCLARCDITITKLNQSTLKTKFQK